MRCLLFAFCIALSACKSTGSGSEIQSAAAAGPIDSTYNRFGVMFWTGDPVGRTFMAYGYKDGDELGNFLDKGGVCIDGAILTCIAPHSIVTYEKQTKVARLTFTSDKTTKRWFELTCTGTLIYSGSGEPAKLVCNSTDGAGGQGTQSGQNNNITLINEVLKLAGTSPEGGNTLWKGKTGTTLADCVVKFARDPVAAANYYMELSVGTFPNSLRVIAKVPMVPTDPSLEFIRSDDGKSMFVLTGEGSNAEGHFTLTKGNAYIIEGKVSSNTGGSGWMNFSCNSLVSANQG